VSSLHAGAVQVMETPSELLLPPPQNPPLTQPPRLQRLFPRRQIPKMIVNVRPLGKSAEAKSSESIMSLSASTSQLNKPGSSKITTAKLIEEAGMMTKKMAPSISSVSQFFNSVSNSSARKESSQSHSFLTVFESANIEENSIGSGRQLLKPLSRPLAAHQRPIAIRAQTPVSEEYINNFPEAAAPENFPGEDPEEQTIRDNLIELQRQN